MRREQDRQLVIDRRDRELDLAAHEFVGAEQIEPFTLETEHNVTETCYWEQTGLKYIDWAPRYEQDSILTQILYSKHGDSGDGGLMKQFQTYVTGD